MRGNNFNYKIYLTNFLSHLPITLVYCSIIIATTSFKQLFASQAATTATINNTNNQILANAEHYNNLTIQSTYSHQNILNNNQYYIDCAGFVHLVLKSAGLTAPIEEVITAIPHNFSPSILNGVPSPSHYMFFLNNQPHKKYWQEIPSLDNLKPGDFIIYNMPNVNNNEHYTERGQHIMIAAGKAQSSSANPKLFWLPVFDATKTNHGYQDNRLHSNKSIGRGIIGIELNSDNTPTTICWRNNHSQPQEPIHYLFEKYCYKRNIKIARITQPRS